MFHRDLTRREDEGVSDFPRMREAGVGLLGASICPGGAAMRLGFWWWGWPAAARQTPLARALAEIALIEDFVASDPDLRLVRFRDDLEEVRARRALGLLLTMEGGEALIGDVARVQQFYERGVRVIGLTHLRDNPLGGSGSPTIPWTTLYLREDAGLTDLGRAVLREMAQLGMVLDLAHASPRMFDEALAVWSGPVIVSHTATAALYPSRRNLTDAQLHAIAARDGVVGILAQTQFLGGDHLATVADHIAHAVSVVGNDHVGLGLDMEEVTLRVLPPELRDVRDLPKLTELLFERAQSDGLVCSSNVSDDAYGREDRVSQPSCNFRDHHNPSHSPICRSYILGRLRHSIGSHHVSNTDSCTRIRQVRTHEPRALRSHALGTARHDERRKGDEGRKIERTAPEQVAGRVRSRLPW